VRVGDEGGQRARGRVRRRQRPEAAVDEQDHEQHRDSAEHVDVGDRQEPDGGDRAAGKLPGDSQDQAPRKGERSAQQRQVDRELEPAQHIAEVVTHDLEVEVLTEEDIQTARRHE
jgi:hypothetical protein